VTAADPIEFWLRPATAEDGPIIRRMIYAARINPTGLRWQRFIVAVDGQDEVIGCGQVKPHRGGSCELASIVVRRRWRGRGVARQIIEALQTSGGPPMWLTCASPLARFYQKFGFHEIASGSQMPLSIQIGTRFFNLMLRLSGSKWRIIGMVWTDSPGQGSGLGRDLRAPLGK